MISAPSGSAMWLSLCLGEMPTEGPQLRGTAQPIAFVEASSIGLHQRQSPDQNQRGQQVGWGGVGAGGWGGAVAGVGGRQSEGGSGEGGSGGGRGESTTGPAGGAGRGRGGRPSAWARSAGVPGRRRAGGGRRRGASGASVLWS